MTNQHSAPTKREALRRLSENLAETGRDERPFRDSDPFDTVYLREWNTIAGADGNCRRIGYGYKGGVFAAAFARVAYEDGEERAYRGTGPYCNKLVLLAVSGKLSEEERRSLLARALLDLGDDAQVIAETADPRVTDMLRDLHFVRLGGTGAEVKRYVFSFRSHIPGWVGNRVSRGVLGTLSREEQRLHEFLQRTNGFSIEDLVIEGWTWYESGGLRFVFVLTTGWSQRFNQDVLKFDLYDAESGQHIAYNDIFVTAGCDCAVNDLPVTEYPSALPESLPGEVRARCGAGLIQANLVRNVWRSQDGIWVRAENRRMGIGQSLERIAGDVCKLLYPHITAIQVLANFDNPSSHLFHMKNGARETRKKLYNIEYPLQEDRRPAIMIMCR